MKKLSETYKELGIAFSFPIRITDSNDNVTYYESSNGDWERWECDAKGYVTYYESSMGYWERWECDANGKRTYYESSEGFKSGTGRRRKHNQTNKTHTMKPLSKTYKELGIAFSFPIEIKDAKGKRTYYEYSDGFWRRWEVDANGDETYYEDSDSDWVRTEYDANGDETYYETSSGNKRGTPRSAKTCEGKVVEVDGIKYKLKAL